MAKRLEGRVAIITGAAQGIGAATALALARFGAHVAVCDRKEDGLRATAREIEALGRRAHVGVLDVRDEDAASAFVRDVGEQFGAVDILVNNAGGGFWSPFVEVSAKGENALIRENFSSVTIFIRHTVPLMTRGGSIINITSIEGHRAGPGFAIYSAMKAAVTNLTFSLSMELASRKISYDFLVRRADDEVPVMTVLEAQQFRPIVLPAAGFLPQLSRLNRRHQELERAGAVHFLADDILDLAHTTQAYGRPGIDARGQSTDQAGAQHQAVALNLSLAGVFLGGIDRVFGPAHGARASGKNGGAQCNRPIIGRCTWPSAPSGPIMRAHG